MPLSAPSLLASTHLEQGYKGLATNSHRVTLLLIFFPLSLFLYLSNGDNIYLLSPHSLGCWEKDLRVLKKCKLLVDFIITLSLKALPALKSL